MGDETHKPLNVWSRSDEQIGKDLSNFAHLPFTLDGVEYASVEGFYAALLIQNNDGKKARTRTMWGIRAKHRIPKTKPEVIHYQDRSFALGSDEHVGLIKRAIRAKLQAHPEVREAFVATAPRPLVHDTGYPDSPDAEFPHTTFCRILTELREELAVEQFSNSAI